MKGLSIAALVCLIGCSGSLQMPDLRGTSDNAPAPAPVVAAPPPPQAPVVLTAKERLVSAIENNGCTLSAANVAVILTEATIGTSELKTLTAELNAEGRASVSGDGAISVQTSRCA